MNVNGVGYTLKDTDNLTGPTDNNIIIKDHAKTYTGFTYNSVIIPKLIIKPTKIVFCLFHLPSSDS